MKVLGIETSCDETGIAIYDTEKGLIADQLYSQIDLHAQFGGVFPEVASRDHIKKIVPLIQNACQQAGINLSDLDGIAYTTGPGLIGALLVGSSVGCSLAWALDLPSVEVHHMEGHLLAPLLDDEKPKFPFVCLLVSGGHSMLVDVQSIGNYQILGDTLDDAAGEAFDKIAKMLGLGYPGGPLLDKRAQLGNAEKFDFPEPKVKGLDYSFSGLKTSVLYFLNNETAKDPSFIEHNINDICASVQKRIVSILLSKLKKASKQYNINEIAIAGGVSANSEFRNKLLAVADKMKWNTYIPKFEYCTDNAAMIAMAGYYKYLKNDFVGLDVHPSARLKF